MGKKKKKPVVKEEDREDFKSLEEMMREMTTTPQGTCADCGRTVYMHDSMRWEGDFYHNYDCRKRRNNR